jgi:hypothetical protein
MDGIGSMLFTVTCTTMINLGIVVIKEIDQDQLVDSLHF